MRGWTLTLTVAVGLTGTARVATAEEEPSTLVLVLITEAKVPGDVLTRAQAEATRIYERIGVTLVWADRAAADSHVTVKIVQNPLGGNSIDRRAMGGAPGKRATRVGRWHTRTTNGSRSSRTIPERIQRKSSGLLSRTRWVISCCHSIHTR